MTRPFGILCPDYVYPPGNNNANKTPYEVFKDYLFNNNTGRTDVVFMASSASAYEPYSSIANDIGDDHSFVGGFIDGFARSVIKGNNTRVGRSVYGTPVYFGYHSNKSYGFDRWTPSTWSNANPKGYGGYLIGSSSYYNDWYYYKPTTGTATSANSSTGHGYLAFNTTLVSPQFDPDVGAETNIQRLQLWASTFWDGETSVVANSPNRALKANFQRFTSLTNQGSTVSAESRNSILSTTTPFSTTFTVTPEQPQRYWNDPHAWIINRSTYIPVGIGYCQNGVITEFTNAAQTYQYVPAGITVGMDETQILAEGSLALYSWNTVTGIWGNVQKPPDKAFGELSQNWGEHFQSYRKPETITWLNSLYANKKLIVRYLTIDQLIAKFNLNIVPQANITNESAWNNCDGFFVTGSTEQVVLKHHWGNPNTIVPIETSAYQTVFLNDMHDKFGIATNSEFYSDWQIGKPLIYIWGRRNLALTTGINSSNEIAHWRFATVNSINNTAQFIGFPVTLSVFSPSTYFAQTSEDTTKLGSSTVNRERGIIVKKNGGSFLDTVTETNGIYTPSLKTLTTQEQTNYFNLYSSSNFKYVVNSYHLQRSSSDSTIANPSFTTSVLSSDSIDNVFTLRMSQNFGLVGSAPTVINGITQRKTSTRTINITSVDLSNAVYNTANYLKFSFCGDGLTGTNTLVRGDILIPTHYGVDANNTNGISFHHLSVETRYRSGDAAYQGSAGGVFRAFDGVEFFTAIYDRQSNTDLGGDPTKQRKLVFMVEVGIWELANPRFSYNGFNTWGYLAHSMPLSGNASISGYPSPDFGFRTISYFYNQAILAGFKQEEIVICFFTPNALTKVNTPSRGNFAGQSYNSPSDELALITLAGNRSNFQRASEIFYNTFNTGFGLFNPDFDVTSYTTNKGSKPAARNCFYMNLGSFNVTNPILFIDNNVKSLWYETINPGETNFTRYSAGGALSQGEFTVNYITNNTVNPIFVPTWLVPFSKMLYYTADPVSGAELTFVTPTTEKTLLGNYYTQYDVLCDAKNIQALRTLAKLKTKILQ